MRIVRFAMDIKIAEVLGPRLQGEPNGRRHFGRMCEALSGATAGEVILLDFQEVLLVTASWISAMIVPLFRWASGDQIDLFFVFRDARDAEWLDDLKLVAQYNHQCYLVVGGESPPRRAKLVGDLDPGQRTTLEAVLEVGEVTGAELERRRPGEKIRATAWNNRLKDLHEKRLLRRQRRGREQVYAPVVKEIELDG
jgi:hypothetical protein